MDFFTLIRKRKSIRSFSKENVYEDVIEKVLQAGMYAPTNCNQQLSNFVVVRDGDTKERLIKEAASNTMFRKVPVVVFITYDGWNYKEALQGGSLALGHMLLAASELGVGALPMNSYGADSRIKKILNIPDNQTICAAMMLGYPDERAINATLVPRRSAKEATHNDTFGSRKQVPFTYNSEDWTKEDLIDHQRYYCRKTWLGKEMDIMSDLERKLVKRELSTLSGSVQDLLSYDGAYIREFPKDVSIETVDLCKETAEYTEAASRLASVEVRASVLGEGDKSSAETSTILFKLERVPKAVRKELFESAQDELLIVARKTNLFLAFFFFVIKFLFGKDVRKTGIYVFFGPYKPISLSSTLKELKAAGYTDISWKGHFALPAFFEQAYQMFLQYRASEGSSYLHRERRSDLISRFIDLLLKVQGLRSVGRLGSVAVIRCRRK